jgi:hypothetical protein
MWIIAGGVAERPPVSEAGAEAGEMRRVPIQWETRTHRAPRPRPYPAPAGVRDARADGERLVSGLKLAPQEGVPSAQTTKQPASGRSCDAARVR